MKKIMIAAAVVVATVCANAASVDWSLGKNSVYTQSGGAAKGVTLFFLNASSTDYADVAAKIATGDITASSIASTSVYLGSGTTGTTNAKAGSLSGTSTANGSSLTAGSNYNIVFVAFEKVGEQDYYYISNAQTASAWGDGTYTQDLASPATWMSGNYVASNWTATAAVPEPTSGLLMLLGIAGLALRRRRA